MACLTDYRAPSAAYRMEARTAPWAMIGGWHRWDDGRWTCVYTRRGRVRTARRAVVHKAGGAWVWKVEEFSLESRRVLRIANRSGVGVWYVSAHAAFAWADAAARTSD